MTIRRLTAVPLFALLLAGAPLVAQEVPFEVEFGNRWVDFSGNEEMYRSQINEREGLLLRRFSLVASPGETGLGLVDRFRLDASGIGAGPDERVRFEVGATKLYRLTVAYARSEQFSALPAFANPFLDRGIVPGQHLLDRDRETFTSRLELLPGREISPIVEYRRFRYDGPGQTTVHVGQDEFRLFSDVRSSEEEVRGGFAVRFAGFSAEALYGERRSTGKERFGLVAGAGGGNNVNPVLGVPVELESYRRAATTDVTTPVASTHVVGQITPTVRVFGSYDSAEPESETEESESLKGKLVSFQISRYFQGLDQSVEARARGSEWVGTGRVEATVFEGVDLSAGWTGRHRELSGMALVTSLFTGTTTFTGLDPKSVLSVMDARNRLERDDRTLDASVSGRIFGVVTLRAGYSETDQETVVSPSPSEVVVPGGQGGTFERTIDRIDVGASAAVGNLRVSVDWDRESADTAVMRTDFVDRDRLRGRVEWKLADRLRISGTALWTKSDNNDAGIGWEGETRQYAAAIDASPLDALDLRVSYGVFDGSSEVVVREPQTFALATSLQDENGKEYEGSVRWRFAGVGLEAGYGRFENEGTFGFRVDRGRVACDVELTKNLGLVLEAAQDRYEESPNLFGDFDGKRYGVFVRWRQ